MPMDYQLTSFLPTTCLTLVDKLSDRQITTEYNRLKDFAPIGTSGVKTRRKSTTLSKKDVIKAALLSLIECKLAKTAEVEDQILSTLKQIEITSCSTNRVLTCEASTSTDEIPVAAAAGTARSEDSLPPKVNAEVLESTVSLQDRTVNINVNDAASYFNLSAVTTRSEGSLPPKFNAEVLENPVLLQDRTVNVNVKDAASYFNLSVNRKKILYFPNMMPKDGVIHDTTPFTKPLPKFLTDVISAVTSIDKDFSLDQYSCTVALYNGGNNHIPYHHEMENASGSSSCIHVVSIGGKSKIELVNRVGPITPVIQELRDGSIYTLSSEYQSLWSHTVLCDAANPVLNFTFKKNCPRALKTRPPPIGLPGTLTNPKRDLLLGNNTHRTLFLTDSILGNITPTSLSCRKNERCIKKRMYYLTDTPQYEAEFEYTSTVVISAGVNDLTRKRLTPEAICDVIVPQLKKYSIRYPNTQFVINSIILTSCKKTNMYIRQLNSYIYDSIKYLKNVHFFNSDSILFSINKKNFYTDRFGIGIHITNQAVEHIKYNLISFLMNMKGP